MREAVSQGARTIKERMHTKGRKQEQCMLHLRVRHSRGFSKGSGASFDVGLEGFGSGQG